VKNCIYSQLEMSRVLDFDPKIRQAFRPIGVLDLGYWSFGCLVDTPPYPPSGHLGPRMCIPNACHGALGRPFFDHFFASILDSILDSSWVRFGLVLGASWDPLGSPNRVKLGQKSVLNRHLFENGDVQKTLENVRREPLF
jgi:hypothetical protein